MTDSKRDPVSGNGETIMVVDDNQQLREFLVAVLKRAGYLVLSADSGPSALALSESTSRGIDLLLTDWDMPEMSGIALGQAMKLARPGIHVMQMSGGAHDSMMVMNYGWAYLQKPFVGPKLVQMVFEVLNSPDRSQLGGESFDTRLGDSLSIDTKDPDRHPADSNEPKDRTN